MVRFQITASGQKGFCYPRFAGRGFVCGVEAGQMFKKRDGSPLIDIAGMDASGNLCGKIDAGCIL